MCALPDLTRTPLVAAPHVPTTPSAGGQLLPDWLVVVAMAFGILVPAEFMLPTWPLVLVLVGGLFYTGGAIVYAMKKPNPWPGHFGFHEIFHVCTVLAFLCHWAACLLIALAPLSPSLGIPG